MANNVLLRRGTGEEMNKKLEELYNTTIKDFGTIGVSKIAESNAEIVAGAQKVITGINVAQYFMVEPIITELLEVLPKPIAKEVFENICKKTRYNSPEAIICNGPCCMLSARTASEIFSCHQNPCIFVCFCKYRVLYNFSL